MFICGSRSFRHQDEDENGSFGSPCSTPKRSKRSTSFSRFIGKDSSNKNPYAGRGLDKFSALLADLDDKRQKIYTQKGSEDIAFVQFAYSTDSKQLKPIVVKVKKKNNNNNKNFLKHLSNSNTITANPADASDKSVNAISQDGEMVIPQQQKGGSRKRYQRWNGSLRLRYCCFPAIVVSILLFLAIYGRSFAILCTSIGCYLIPSIVGGSSSSSSSSGRKPKRKVISEKNIVNSEGPSSPTSVVKGPTDNTITQQQHGHRRSW
ncbi:hypothetical protein Pfo_016811 [Paulownia fortunei]|nr:hypothetical protein Pfo_016811 [Paulownia fortunei]